MKARPKTTKGKAPKIKAPKAKSQKPPAKKQRPEDTCKDMFADTEEEDFDVTVPDLVIDFGSEGDEESTKKKKDEPQVPDPSMAIKVLTPGAKAPKAGPSKAGPSDEGPSAKDLAEAGPSSLARKVKTNQKITFMNMKNNICITLE